MARYRGWIVREVESAHLHMLVDPTAVLKLDGQPVQKLWMRRLLALQAEIFRCAHQAFAKSALPDAVD